jgi:UDP-N-acetylglucosamine--N-acetylmuramyl-(pentapeptide) pyrophosphoryl-undecaprenol N-acetylglucosamine transferase
VAHRIYTAFPEVRGLPADRVRFVGNPVRAAIRDAAGAPLPEGPFAVLVVGGSQGARGINRAVAEALPALVRAGIRLMHQTGEADFSAMEAAFRAAGASGEVRPFFADMARRYRACHLVLSRSGASTAAEIAAVGRGAVLVPFPFAADDHQTANARALVAAGAAETIPESALDGDALARILVRLADRPAQVAAMARAARTLGRPDAASRMVADILALSERFGRGRKGGSAKTAKSADSNLR